MLSACRMSVRPRVIVVGAGVIGMSVAVHLTERFGEGLSVTVVADKFTPDTTSDKAGGLIMPIDFADAEVDMRVQQWTRDTFEYFHTLLQSKEASDVELCLTPGYVLKRSESPDPWWKDLVFGFRHVDTNSTEAQVLHLPPSLPKVWGFTTYMMDCRKYLPFLMKRFQENGGLIEKRKIENLEELAGYDLIINCVGLAARSLVSDNLIKPVRGQGILVRAPWVKPFIISDAEGENMTYILPRANDILLGGTAQEDNWDQTPDPQTAREIRQRCEALVPSLANVEAVGGWAGLRPVRKKVRLEVERGGSVIHCYGHGGQGIVLHWGCALEVGRIVYSGCWRQ